MFVLDCFILSYFCFILIVKLFSITLCKIILPRGIHKLERTFIFLIIVRVLSSTCSNSRIVLGDVATILICSSGPIRNLKKMSRYLCGKSIFLFCNCKRLRLVNLIITNVQGLTSLESIHSSYVSNKI